MKKSTCLATVFLFTVLALAAGPVWAEIVDQTFTLRPGWNAVFLEVEPVSTDPAAVFSGLPVQSIWRWNPQNSTVEFIQDPDTLVPDDPQWMVYYPGNPVLTNLYSVSGEAAYLILVSGGADVSWTVTGHPTVPRIGWKANSFNFVGFHLLPGQEPYFDDFFSASPAHAGQDVYTLDNVTGSWIQVTSPTVQMRAGEGFWVYCKGYSEFTGPLAVQLEQSTGLHFGTKLSEQDLRLYNHSTATKDVHLTVTSAPSLYLHYWQFNPANNIAEWVEFPSAANLDLSIPPGGTQKLRLGARRAGLTAGAVYEDNLVITDESSNIRLPVSVTGVDFSGLWVGSTTIREVSQPTNDSDPGAPVDAGSEFSFRLILHVDSSSQARLLKEVVQLWQEGTWMPDPNDLGKLVPDEPGRFVLIANEGLLPLYTGAALRDGQPVGRRISSPAFGFAGPRLMGGIFALGGSLTLTLTLPADDPSNPFRHKFHPDHKVPAQSYEVTRSLTLELTDTDDQGRPLPGASALSWGSSEVGGIYTESLWGLHKQQINIQGTFLLRKASDIEQVLY